MLEQNYQSKRNEIKKCKITEKLTNVYVGNKFVYMG